MLALLAVLSLGQTDPWQGEKRRFIVELADPNPVLQRFSAAELKQKRRFRTIPAVAVELTYPAYLRLRAMPEVAKIDVDEPIRGALMQAVPAISGDLAKTQYPTTGKNVVVAVIDSGVDFTHPSLAGSKVAEHCFTNGDCLPSRTDESTSGADEAGHGTEVTGVIRSKGALEGVAPDAKIISVRVLDSQNRGYTSDWLAGLDWVYQNRATTGVRVVNMSLVTDALYSASCAAQNSTFASLVTQARNAGIVIFAASGNNGSSTQTTAPACLPGVISVGATYDASLGREPDAGNYGTPACYDAATSTTQVTCFSNTNATVKLLAPGRVITTTAIGGGSANVWGTSFSSPMAAGVAALMLELSPGLTPQEIEQAMTSTGTPVTDARNGLTFPLVNALGALDTITQSFCSGKPDGTACQDGDACTQGDACVGGACVAGAPLTCAASACQTAAACDPTTGACVGAAKPNGTACDDGNACTSGDACNAGACVAGKTKSCGSATDCRAAGVCDPATGACEPGAPLEDGSFCDDDNACTKDDACRAGECVGGSQVSCSSPPACHGAGTCEAMTGMCVYPKLATCDAVAPQGTAATGVTEKTGCDASGAASVWYMVLALFALWRYDRRKYGRSPNHGRR